MSKKVLIVDDTPGGAAPIREILMRAAWTALEATSGRQAIEIHRREHVDLIIMDLQMVGLDGEQVTRAIRADAAMRDVSILVFSDTASPSLRERCLAFGANDFIAKPFTSEQLMSRIWSLLNVAERKRTMLLAHVDVVDSGPAIEPFVARISNLSTSGLLLEADAALAEGRTVVLTFFVPGESVQAKVTATVVRRTAFAGIVSWGLRFAPLEPAVRQMLTAYTRASKNK
ncbi:MAG TPA: response regulator [Vicinamibacterales bacterium]|nr:response regulator [Vicinamibacterales bacterium]